MAKIDTENSDYFNFVELLGIFTHCQQRLDEIQLDLDTDIAGLVEDIRGEYAEMQAKQGDAERAILTLCERHPEWLTKPRTIKTPSGSVSAKSSSNLIVLSEDSTIRLIKSKGLEAEFIRTVEELDLEALEKLDDSQLKKFGIQRAVSDRITVKPAKMDLGKAVKAATEKEAA